MGAHNDTQQDGLADARKKSSEKKNHLDGKYMFVVVFLSILFRYIWVIGGFVTILTLSIGLCSECCPVCYDLSVVSKNF